MLADVFNHEEELFRDAKPWETDSGPPALPAPGHR